MIFAEYSHSSYVPLAAVFSTTMPKVMKLSKIEQNTSTPTTRFFTV